MITYDKLWEYLKTHDVSQYKLAQECGIGNSTVERLKKNATVRTDTLEKICRVLNCNIEDICQYIDTENKKN